MKWEYWIGGGFTGYRMMVLALPLLKLEPENTPFRVCKLDILRPICVEDLCNCNVVEKDFVWSLSNDLSK